MSLASGSKLSYYDILGPLGAGAMGEVYLARDTRLDREVAIKVLPEHFAKDEERLKRFAREAKSLASFNHPNVAQIHGVDQTEDTYFLVLELVPGETLAERLSRGPLAVEEALRVCVQIASGLEAAHEAGVIHRDLKPGNIKLTPEGKAKVLDFGLARQEATRERPSSMVGPLTEVGALVGTPGYMSPEQLRGKPIDRRTDVFAFGCVLYACLVGEPAFPGESPSDVIAATLEGEPDLARLPSKVSARVRELIVKCLARDLQHRLRDIGDARIELERAIANKEWSTAKLAAVSDGGGSGGASRAARPWIAGGALGVAAALAIGYVAAPRLWRDASNAESSPPAVARFVVNPSRLFAAGDFDTTTTLAISRDGTRIAFLARDATDADARLYVRDLSALEATPVTGGVLAFNPFFSPDGNWLVYSMGGQLWKAPLRGGPRAALGKPIGFDKGSVWGADGIIISPKPNAGLSRLAPESGELTALTEVDASKGESSQRWPELLPDGRHVLCTVKKAGMATFDDADIAVYSMDSREWKTVLHGGYFAKYARTGHLLYVREGGILAVPFDVQRLEVTGQAVRVVSGVSCEPTSGAAQFALSENGTLVFAPGGPVEGLVDLLWIDRAGNESPVRTPARPYRDTALSPDGGRIALTISGATDSVYVYDVARGTLTRVTQEGNCSRPAWTPDGENLVYGSDRESGGMYRSRADGSGAPVKLLSEAEFGRDVGGSFVGSTSTLLIAKGHMGERDLWTWSAESGSAPLLASADDQWSGEVSRDGKWLAYTSNESGRAEIYVRPFGSGTGRWQISKDGGEGPQWSADGKELFFLSGASSDYGGNRRRAVFSVSVATSDGFVPSAPTTAFEWNGSGFCVAPDGKRLLIMRPRDPPVRTTEIYAVLNWFEELRKLAPSPAR